MTLVSVVLPVAGGSVEFKPLARSPGYGYDAPASLPAFARPAWSDPCHGDHPFLPKESGSTDYFVTLTMDAA